MEPLTSDGFEFYVDPLAQGRVTPRALLAPTGTIIFPFVRELLTRRIYLPLTRLAGAGWFFNIGLTGGKLVIQRNRGQLVIDDSWCDSRSLPETFLASWTPSELILSFGDHSSHWNYPQRVVGAPMLGPPEELVRWVRRQELSAVDTFASEDEFVLRVHSSLQRFEERFRPLLNGNTFWDFDRRGNSIIARKPKREVDVQAALHAMLADHMQLSSIDTIREARSPAGAADFLLQAPLETGAIAKIVIEFKNAHSRDLISGLVKQLRQYMEYLEVPNGAYCVLDYRGRWFRQPKCSTERLMTELHNADRPYSKRPCRPIKIHWLELGRIGEAGEHGAAFKGV